MSSRNGALMVRAGGIASGTTIYAGGSETISAGGTDVGAQISGGTQYDYGSASGDTIYGGGFQVVESGGTASGTAISSGGQEVVSSGGIANRTMINGGGVQVINVGGGRANGSWHRDPEWRPMARSNRIADHFSRWLSHTHAA